MFVSWPIEVERDFSLHDRAYGFSRPISPVSVEQNAVLSINRAPFHRRIVPVALCERPDLRAADPGECPENSREVDLCSRAQQDQLTRMLRVSCRIGLRHETAKGQTADDRLDYTERITKPFHIVAPLREIPRRRIVSLAAPIASMIVEDDLGYIAQGRKRILEGDVIKTGAAMKHQRRRLFPQPLAIGDKARVRNIDK